MQLNYGTHVTAGTDPQKWLFLLHGFLGKARNWDALCKKIVAARPDWGIIAPDLRLHGDSQDIEGPHTLKATAEDLVMLARSLNVWPDALAGHSFGGKVVLEACKLFPDPAQVWVLDSTADAMAPGGAAYSMMGRMRRLTGPFESRKAAISLLQADGLTVLEAQWMATNLERCPDGFRWRLDIESLNDLIMDFYRQDLWPVIEAPMAEQFIFVKASKSQILTETAQARLKALGQVLFTELEGGHWLNVANPQGLLALFVQELK